MRKIKVKTTTSTTTPGYVNPNGQTVIRDTGFSSTSFPGQRIYHLRCEPCGYEYGSNGTDIFKRLCPAHQNGTTGEPLRDAGPGLFD